jgi:hypothetical protein
MFVTEKKRCFFSMMTLHHTLVLPLQWQWRASDLKLFHTFPTAWIWHHLTLLFAALKTHLKGIPSHVVKKWFQEQLEEFYTDWV